MSALRALPLVSPMKPHAARGAENMSALRACIDVAEWRPEGWKLFSSGRSLGFRGGKVEEA